MRRVVLVAISCLSFASPVSAQWGGGAAQAGATAYCGARAAGKSHRQANNAAMTALVTGMPRPSISTIVVGGGAMRDSMTYLIKQQCPSYFFNNSTGPQRPAKSKEEAEWDSYCFDNPWLKECGGQNPAGSPCVGCGGKPGEFPKKGEIKPDKSPPPKATQAEIKASQRNWDKRMAEQFCMKAADFTGCMKYKMAE